MANNKKHHKLEYSCQLNPSKYPEVYPYNILTIYNPTNTTIGTVTIKNSYKYATTNK